MGIRSLPNATEAVISRVRVVGAIRVRGQLGLNGVTDAVHDVHSGEEPAGGVDFLGIGNARGRSGIIVGDGGLASIGIGNLGWAGKLVVVKISGGLVVLILGDG